QGYRHVHLLSK
nr:inositol 1,4,5-trisphosphate binding protein [rats, brain, Peptide Partial, 11 aa] [Rattus sp.]